MDTDSTTYTRFVTISEWTFLFDINAIANEIKDAIAVVKNIN
jgi:hypothetical protein